MSKENANGKPEDEELVVIEVDDQGRPINGSAEEPDDDGDKDDLDDGGAEGADDGDGAEDDDERLGHSEQEDNEGAVARRERRRREQRAKRVRNRVAAESKDRLIENQGRLLLNLQEQVAKLQGRTVQYDVNLLQSQLAQVESQQAEAKTVFINLSKSGDSEGLAEVVELQMALRDQHRMVAEQLRRAKGPGRKGPEGAEDQDNTQQAPPARKGPTPDPEVIRRAQVWAERNKWLTDPKTDPEDIAIARAVDQNMHREGWDPRTDDYWQEFNDRLAVRLPHYFKSKPGQNGRGNNGRSHVNSNGNGGQRPAQGGPRMAPVSQTGSRQLGRNEVYVSPARKEALQKAGMWDDPVKRNRVLAQYKKFDSENPR
jgi:hypothetical protein